MKDYLLEKFFESDRWENAIETGVIKGIDKSELRKLCSPEYMIQFLLNILAIRNSERI